jgi:superfamily II DNA helicase RecQ
MEQSQSHPNDELDERVINDIIKALQTQHNTKPKRQLAARHSTGEPTAKKRTAQTTQKKSKLDQQQAMISELTETQKKLFEKLDSLKLQHVEQNEKIPDNNAPTAPTTTASTAPTANAPTANANKKISFTQIPTIQAADNLLFKTPVQSTVRKVAILQ